MTDLMAHKHVLLRRRQLYHGEQEPEEVTRYKPRTPSGFDYTVTQVGKTEDVSIYLATNLQGAVGGTALAAKVTARAQQAFQATQAFFGQLKLPQVNLLIAPLSGSDDGSGGAYHYGCAATDLYADDDLSDDGSTTLALFVAELSEVGQATQNKGWQCGSSNGEALSRLHAETLFPGVLDDYSTAGAWLDSDRHDWISRSEPTDQNAVSTGCGVLFLTWLLAHGCTVHQITQAASDTLAGTYQLLGLGPASLAYSDFRKACEERWPTGKPSGVETDNPWGVQPPTPQPPPVPQPPPPVPPTAPPPVSAPSITITEALPAGQYLLVPVPAGIGKIDWQKWLAIIEAILGALGNKGA